MEDIPQANSEIKVSKYSAAWLINSNLENLWVEIFKQVKNGNYNSWNKVLDCIWLILARDVETNSEEEKKYMDIEMEIGKTGSLVHTKTGFDITGVPDMKILSLQYRLLMQKALFLGRLQNKQGKGTSYKEDEDYWE